MHGQKQSGQKLSDDDHLKMYWIPLPEDRGGTSWDSLETL